MLFTSASAARELADYVNSELNEISVTYPYSNIQLQQIDYCDFEVVTKEVIKKSVGCSDGLLDYTASERYSRLGIGWEFDFPYIEKRYGYDDREYEYLHFGDKGTYLIDFSSDSPENHLDGYPLNDLSIAYDSSVIHDGIRSEYAAAEKDGTRYWFGSDGRLLIKEDRYGNRISFYCGTEVFADAWGNNRVCPYIERIVDSVGREVLFSTENDSAAARTYYMSISNPNDAEEVRVWEYYQQKVSVNDIGILQYPECRRLQKDKWVLKNTYDPEGRRTIYSYSFTKSKFSFLDRNRAFHTEYADVRDSSKGNSYVTKSNIEQFAGAHNVYALVTSVSNTAGKCYGFAYGQFVKNCTSQGSMIFAKAYLSYEESVVYADGDFADMNRRTYLYDINGVGEYDGYISHRYEDRINSGYNYAVKVTDANMPDNKYSYRVYSYSYVGADRDKTILLASLDDRGSDHRFVTDYSYDSTLKLPLQIVQRSYDAPDSPVGMTKSVSYTYDAGKYGDVLSETPNGDSNRTVTYTYNADYHFPTSRVYRQSADREIKYEYVPSADGKNVEYINIYENSVLKNKVHYSHDSYGNIIVKKEFAGDFADYTETDYSYQNGAELTAETSKNITDNDGAAFDVTVTAAYDYADRQTKTIDVMGNSTRIEYDAYGRKIKEYDADNYAAEYKYDKLGRMIEQRTPIEEKNGTVYYAVKKMWYDKVGSLTKERVYTNASGAAEKYSDVEYAYDNRSRLVMTKANDGYRNNYVQNYYDPTGNLLRVYTGLLQPLTINGCDDVTGGGDSNYAVIKYVYDRLGRVTEITDALGQSETKTYDNASGLMTASTDRKGQTFVYGYDGLCRLKSKSMADGTNAEIKVYNAIGKIHSLQNGTSTINYTYNAKGLPASESDTSTGTTKLFDYDSDGNRTSFTLIKDGQTKMQQTYAYDKMNRLITVSENGAVIASYAYDGKSNRTRMISGGVTTDYTYNIGNLLTSQTSGDKLTEEYAYYLNGNIKTKTVNGEVTTYRYDGMNRLSNENGTEYFFDNFGNRLAMLTDDAAVDYEYDLNNRLVKITEYGDDYVTKTVSMFYDRNGNLISKAVMTNKRFGEDVSGDYTVSQNSDENVALYEYNCYNQLTGADTGGVMSRYTYLPDGMRAAKTVGGNTTAFVYDNSNIVAEITADGMNKYLRGAELIKNGDGIYYVINGMGDAAMLLNPDGNAAASYVFDAYGVQISGGDVYNPLGYRGEYTDSESGLIYLRARMYDPATGRFLTEDPAHDGDNWYVYCSNNPIVFVDPTGFIRIPGYVNGVWSENPDAQEFGEDSVVYSSLCTLGDMWMTRTDNRADISNLAEQVRRFARQKTFNAKLSLIMKFAPASANSTDLVILAGDSDKAFFASSDMKTAQKYADLIYGKDSDGSQHNALKHTMWNALMTDRYGAEYAKMIANSHEFGAVENLKQDQLQQDLMNMDLWNNSIGRSLGESFKKSHWYGNYKDELAWEIVRQINDKKIWVVNWTE